MPSSGPMTRDRFLCAILARRNGTCRTRRGEHVSAAPDGKNSDMRKVVRAGVKTFTAADSRSVRVRAGKASVSGIALG